MCNGYSGSRELRDGSQIIDGSQVIDGSEVIKVEDLILPTMGEVEKDDAELWGYAIFTNCAPKGDCTEKWENMIQEADGRRWGKVEG